jgi:hypothetical protein
VSTIESKLKHFSMEVGADGVAVVSIDRAGRSVNSLAPELTADLSTVIDR